MVSNSEDIVVSGYYFIGVYNDFFLFKTLDKTNYELDDLFGFPLPDKFIIDPRKARFTQDDNFFFFNMKHT